MTPPYPVTARALETVAQSRARSVASRDLLEQSYDRLWSARRHARRCSLITGGSDAPTLPSARLRQLVRAGLDAGRLPAIENRVIARLASTEQLCAVCEQAIHPPDPEYQPDGNGAHAHVAHWHCYAMWLFESSVRARRPGMPGAGDPIAAS